MIREEATVKDTVRREQIDVVCPERQDIVPVLGPAPAFVSVTADRHYDYVLSFGTAIGGRAT